MWEAGTEYAESIAVGHKGTLGMVDLFTLLIMVMISCAYTYVKTFQIAQLKFIQFIEYQIIY